MKTVNLVIPVEIPEVDDEEEFIKEFLYKLAYISSSGRANKYLTWTISRRIDEITTMDYTPRLRLDKWEYLGDNND